MCVSMCLCARERKRVFCYYSVATSCARICVNISGDLQATLCKSRAKRRFLFEKKLEKNISPHHHHELCDNCHHHDIYMATFTDKNVQQTSAISFHFNF